ncbi:MAG: amino acid dehydrogenase [Bacteroidetes bacterium]|nr:MAG: amino acid dehydrogenase [Bacteroidota bacterium]REK00389.1 MAG: amino acid dehydrogenase [Bacteroidota bacterium]REK35508.1 MAG: amino acid dehydrogenase [Bacteroidota bacterium]REK50173.1 MAG: amino acid dehydrogenase [Bacteroidota bacterium]
MRDLIRQFEGKRPEIVFEWKDSETEAEGWIVINSLRGGSAGGGTRMRKGLDRHEVESLAKTMEIKFFISGPPIGGAKSGINFDPHDPRKKGVLERWYRAVMPLLKGYYGTGGDLNVDEIHEVIPITASLGLKHPQEGTVNAHFHASAERKNKIIQQLQAGVKKVLDNPQFSPDLDRNITVADMITGYGVAESVFHYYRLNGKDIHGKRAIIQGWGNVGAAAGYYLSQHGVKITGIIDRHGGVINQRGFSPEQVKTFFLERNGNQLFTRDMISADEIKDKIWHTGAEIFIPAAASRLVQKSELETMIDNSLELISSGANVPFADSEIFFGPIAEFADNSVAVIPDFIANCGMARVFRYLMNDDVKIEDSAIFDDVSSCIADALKHVMELNSGGTGFSRTSLEWALGNLLK